jgi:hydroxyacylglutathione hydrolase
VGYERRFNWALEPMTEDEFVARVLAEQPEPPAYFGEMKRINQQGPRPLGGFRRPDRLPAERLATLVESGAVVVDTRPAPAFAAGHVPGTINIPLNRSFTTWAGWLVPYGREFYLIATDGQYSQVDEAVRDLVMIGLDQVAGWFDGMAIAAFAARGRALGTVPQISAGALADGLLRGDVAVIDVRGRAEWEAGHLPGVEHLPLGYLVQHLDQLPRDRPLVVHCQSGARSAIAASLLLAKGLDNVVNLTGGFSAWQAAGYPVETAAQALVSTP